MGKLLAQKTGLPFYDLDDLMVEREKKTIPAIFTEKGEHYFRETEHAVLKHFLEEKKLETYVLALGGGTPCFYNNIELIKQEGKLFYLDTPLDILVSRLAGNQNRPLLENNPEKKLEELLEKRWPYYRQSHFNIDAGRKAETVVGNILHFL